MKIFQIENNICYYDATLIHPTIESTIDKSLSDFEKQVLHRYLNGESYVKIAEKLNTQVKSIDNAIQRIRKKAIKNIDY